MTVLTTTRLTLRRITNDDAPFLIALLNDPSFIRYIGDRHVRTMDDAFRYIADGPASSYERFGFGLWLVTLMDSQQPIGICGLLKRDALPHVDLGFALLPEFRAQGYAQEAARGVLDYARDELVLSRVIAVVQADNERSLRLLQALGFASEGQARLSADGPELLLLGINLATKAAADLPAGRP
jgi:ribosomal-protein-alanine N-acetyltransferase